MVTIPIYPNDSVSERKFGSDNSDTSELGVVYKKIGGYYTVHLNGRILECSLSNRLSQPEKAVFQRTRKSARHQIHSTKRQPDPQTDGNSVVVGDIVQLVESGAGGGVIVSVIARRNKIARRSAVPMPGAHPFEQVIAANLDRVVPVFAAADPAPKWNMLDRYLVSAAASGIPALICITKLDLAPDDQQAEFWRELGYYQKIGYSLVAVSALTGQGLEVLRIALDGRFSVFLGKSGVGKTTLLNALQPGLGLRVNAISQATGKGKHTTTHQEMFPFQKKTVTPESTNTGAIIDTPGVREFGLWDISPHELVLFFPEMSPFVGCCRFGLDCGHDEEPDCAIRKAVMDGQISPRRYQSYLRLKEEL
jgi:ribosome biogenesis GTPase